MRRHVGESSIRREILAEFLPIWLAASTWNRQRSQRRSDKYIADRMRQPNLIHQLPRPDENCHTLTLGLSWRISASEQELDCDDDHVKNHRVGKPEPGIDSMAGGNSMWAIPSRRDDGIYNAIARPSVQGRTSSIQRPKVVFSPNLFRTQYFTVISNARQPCHLHLHRSDYGVREAPIPQRSP